MTVDQVGDVNKLYTMKATGADGKPSSLGKAFEREHDIAYELVQACKNRVDCYLEKLVEPAAQERETQFQGVKAAYMVGVLGGPEVREKLIERMPKLTSPAVRYVAVTAIDHLSPRGDVAIAAKLQQIVDEGEASKNKAIISVNAPFKTVIYRLRARAQP